MTLKTLLTVGLMTLAAGLLPAGVQATAAPAPTAAAVPLNAAAFADGSAAHVAQTIVVRRNRGYYGDRRGYYGRPYRRGYYGRPYRSTYYRPYRGRVVRRVYVDGRGRRRVIIRRY